MNEREQRIEELFHQALELAGAEREAHLERACGEDRELLRELRSLLEAASQIGDVLDRGAPALDLAEALAVTSEAPERIGPYRVLETLGRGSFGVVYKVEQEQPVRRILALKVIQHGMASDQVVARFEAERQALAMLDHRGVAKVFDAGETADGRPYFVLEHVPGIPISEYADRHKLDTRERLRLLVKVCAAVQHAHQKGIVHRDLKPSNILVKVEGDTPEPVVIDFGLAKALHTRLAERTLMTRQGYFLGTLEYASPEQLRSDGLDIDTRTDIYSLGVLLYKLLTGNLPIDSKTMRKAGALELQRLICDVEPARPSRYVAASAEESTETARLRGTDPAGLQRLLRGDLDWITLKALAKDRTRRYASASELAADIERHLADEPVLAAPPELGYRVAKFVRRNRLLVGAAAAVFLALVAGVIGTWSGWRRAAHARDAADEARLEAEQESQVTRAMNQYLNEMLSSANPWSELGDSTRARETRVVDVLDRAASSVGRSFAGLPRVEAAVRTTLGENYRDMGLLESAEAQLRTALALDRRELGPEHPDTILATSLLASAVMRLGKNEEGRELSQQALAGFRSTLGAEAPQTLYEVGRLADAEQRLGNFPRSIELARQAREGLLASVGPEHPGTQEVTNTLAQSLRLSGRYEEAEELLQTLYRTLVEQHGESHPNTAAVLASLAALYADLRRTEEAEDAYRIAVQIGLETLGEEHPQTLVALLNLGNFLRNTGRAAEARSTLERTRELCERLLGPAHPYTLIARSNLGLVLIDEQRYGEAERVFRACLESSEHGSRAGADTAIYRSNLAFALQGLGRYEEAEALYRRVLEDHRRVLGEAHPECLHALNELAVCYLRAGKTDEAEPLLRRGVELARGALPPDHPGRRDLLQNLVGLLRERGREQEAAEAESELRALE